MIFIVIIYERLYNLMDLEIYEVKLHFFMEVL